MNVIGDQSLNGWATFIVYLVVAWLCATNARRSAAVTEPGGRGVELAQSRRRFWIVLAALLLLLGLSRQLDLQALLADAARSLLRRDDVYGERSGLQLGLVIAIGVFGTIGLLLALVTFRRADGAILSAMAGAAILMIFTVIRTISLHDVDRLLRQGVPHFQVNNLIEIGALILIAISAYVFARRLRAEGESARLRALAIQERRRLLAEKRRAAGS